MRRNWRSWFTALVVFLCLGFAIKRLTANSSGSPGNRTGSPGDGGVSCAACHFGGPGGSGGFSLNVGPTYTPGQVFNLTLTRSGPRGFEIVAERTDTNQAVGSWTAQSGNKAVAEGLTHSFSSQSSWSFIWTAPNSNVGTIKIYVAGPDAPAGGGRVYLSSFTLSPPPTPQISSPSPSFGSVNQTVTISGSNFGSSFSTVTFSGSPSVTAPCSSWASTSIVCRVPAGAASGNVTVTTSRGTSNGVNFNVITGAPGVSAISPSVGSSTSTSFSATISGQNLSPGATVQLTKTGAANITGSVTSISASTSFTASFNLTLAGSSTGQWNVAVTNPDGQLGTGADLLRIDKIPPAPTGFGGTALSASSIQWGWTDVADNEDGYRVLTSTDGRISPDLPANAANFTESGLLPNRQVIRKAQSFNPIGASTSSTAAVFTLPNSPSNPAFSSVFITSASVSWSANSNQGNPSYEVSLSTDNFVTSFSTPVVFASNLTATTTALLNLTPATTTFFRVRAQGGGGAVSDFSPSASTRTLPAAPVSLAFVSVSTDSLQLSWGKNGNPDTVQYIAELSTGSFPNGFSGNKSSMTFLDSASLSGLSANTTYFARVKAQRSDGVQSSAVSNSTATLANIPGDMEITATSTATVSFRYDSNLNPSDTLYQVQVATSSDFTTVTGSAQIQGTSGQFAGLIESTTYYLRCRARNRNNIFTDFNVFDSSITRLGIPSDFSAAALSTISIRWNWTDNSGSEAGFRIYLSTGGLLSPDLAPNAAGYTAADLQVNTAYQAFVRAFGLSGVESEDSNVFTRWTLADPPSGLAAAAVAGSSASLKVFWSTSAASGYGLERSTFSSGGFLQIVSSATLTAQTSFYFDSGLLAKTSYFYRLRGFNGESAPTDYIGPEFDVTHPPLPRAPVLLGAAVSTTSIRWSWNIPADVAGFALLTSTDGVIVYLAGNGSTYLEVGLSSGTSYSRRLKAVNGTGASFSNLATVSTPQDQQAVPAASSTTLTAGNATVEIPAGALGGSGDVLISLDPRANPLLDSTASDIAFADAALSPLVKPVPGSIGEFLAIVGGSRKTDNFASAATLAFSYPDADSDGIVDGVSPAIRAGNLSVYALNESLNRWEAISSQVSLSSKTVSAQAAHFSVFALFGVTASSNLSSIKVFPNPLRPRLAGHDKFTFTSLPSDAALKVYTILGELLSELDADSAGMAFWNGKNKSGNSVSSGVYLVYIRSGKNSKIIKIAIER